MTKAQVKRHLKKILAIFYRIGLHNRDFTILSNNCWGGMVYDRYALQYRTPTIGLWMLPKDFIKFLSNIDFYLNLELKQISYKEFHGVDLLIERKKSGRYTFELDDMIIGRLGDVDIVFLHYSSFADACLKWNKRKQRINRQNLIIKFNDQNGCTSDDFNEFQKLSYENKLFFTSNSKYIGLQNVMFFSKYKHFGYVYNDTHLNDCPLNIKKYLNDIIQKKGN